jgi:hypothetical protein
MPQDLYLLRTPETSYSYHTNTKISSENHNTTSKYEKRNTMSSSDGSISDQGYRTASSNVPVDKATDRNTTSASTSSGTHVPATLAGTPFALTRLLLELAPMFHAIDAVMELLEWKSPTRSMLVLALWWIGCISIDWIFIYALHWIVAGLFLRWYWQRRQSTKQASNKVVSDVENLHAVSQTLDALNMRLARWRVRWKKFAVRMDLAAGELMRWWFYTYPPWCIFNYQVGIRWSVAILGAILISWKSPWMRFLRRFFIDWLPRVHARIRRQLRTRAGRFARKNGERNGIFLSPLIQFVLIATKALASEDATARRRRSMRRRRRGISTKYSGASSHGTDLSMVPIPEEKDEPQEIICPDFQAKLAATRQRDLNAGNVPPHLGERISLPGESGGDSDTEDEDDEEVRRAPTNIVELEARDVMRADSIQELSSAPSTEIDDTETSSDEIDDIHFALSSGLVHRFVLLEHQRWWVGLGWLTRFLPFDPYPW